MSTTPSPNPPAVGATPPATPKKKSNALWWILGIFAGIVLFGVIAVVGIGYFVVHKVSQTAELGKKNPVYAAAKFAASMNPDVEIVSSDDDSGKMVVREKKTGKTVTMKFDPEKKTMVVTDENGKEASISVTGTGSNSGLEIKGADGNVKLGGTADKAPSWVPVYPGSSPQSTMSANDNGKQSGMLTFVTQDPPDKVISFFADALKTSGLTVSTTTSTTDGKVSGGVTAKDADDNRTMVVVVGAQSNGTNVMITFGEKKQGI